MNFIFLTFVLLSVGQCVLGSNSSLKEFELYIQSTYGQLNNYYKSFKENSRTLDIGVEMDKLSVDQSTIMIYQTYFNNKKVTALKELIKDGIANGRKLSKCNHMLNQKMTDRAGELSEHFFGKLRAWLKAKSVIDLLFERPKIEIEVAIERGVEAIHERGHGCKNDDLSKCRVLGYQVSDAQLLTQMLDNYEHNLSVERSKAFKNFNENMYENFESEVLAPVTQCIDKN